MEENKTELDKSYECFFSQEHHPENIKVSKEHFDIVAYFIYREIGPVEDVLELISHVDEIISQNVAFREVGVKILKKAGAMDDEGNIINSVDENS